MASKVLAAFSLWSPSKKIQTWFWNPITEEAEPGFLAHQCSCISHPRPLRESISQKQQNRLPRNDIWSWLLTLTCTQVYVHTNTYSCATLMCTRMFMPIQTHAHAHTHTCMQTYTRAHTHVHTQCTCLKKEERMANYYSLRIYYEPRNGPSAFADLGSHHSAWCLPESFFVPILWMSTLSPISHR